MVAQKKGSPWKGGAAKRHEKAIPPSRQTTPAQKRVKTYPKNNRHEKTTIGPGARLSLAVRLADRCGTTRGLVEQRKENSDAEQISNA